MSHRVELKQAAGQLQELVLSLRPGDEIVLTQDDREVGRIVGSPARQQPVPGLGRGVLTIVNDDDSHLEDFKDYM